MQGRLSPKYKGRYQAHPVGYWQGEFLRAAELGLECIEFILDFEDAEKNPLLSESGVDEILKIADETGVCVRTVCADYFMEAPLHIANESSVAMSVSVLQRLLHFGRQLALTDIVIPCVDQSSMADRHSQDRFVANLSPLLKTPELASINLCLETDLAPQPFTELLNQFDSKRVTVNYDTGNSAALGYDPVEELSCYGNRISDIHIKDRIRSGGSVLLGNGDTDF